MSRPPAVASGAGAGAGAGDASSAGESTGTGSSIGIPPPTPPAGDKPKSPRSKWAPVIEPPTRSEEDEALRPGWASLIFSGTGTSSGVPTLSCLLRRPIICKVCESTQTPGSRNQRRNTGVVMRVRHPTTGEWKVVAIDCGKYFWHSALELFTAHPELGGNIDALILTHDHFDAIGGLDDLREFTHRRQKPIHVYCSQTTFNVVKRMFPYLVNSDKATGSGFVALLQYHIITETVPFEVEGMKITPFSVFHGDTYRCMAFRFGSVAYLSDVSKVPDDARPFLKGVRTAIIDTLRQKNHCSHFGIEQAIEELSTGFGTGVPVTRGYLVGMNHTLDQEATNAALHKRGLGYIQLAYDGLRIEVCVDTEAAGAMPKVDAASAGEASTVDTVAEGDSDIDTAAARL